MRHLIKSEVHEVASLDAAGVDRVFQMLLAAVSMNVGQWWSSCQKPIEIESAVLNPPATTERGMDSTKVS